MNEIDVKNAAIRRGQMMFFYESFPLRRRLKAYFRKDSMLPIFDTWMQRLWWTFGYPVQGRLPRFIVIAAGTSDG